MNKGLANNHTYTYISNSKNFTILVFNLLDIKREMTYNIYYIYITCDLLRAALFE